MRLVVTEKPSVARDLARVLGARRSRDGWIEGDDLRITWCVGHLLELDEPASYDDAWKRWSLDTLPMIPQRFSLRVRQSSSDQWRVVARLLGANDVDVVINACDAGREGELIFRYAYEHAGCTLPTQRFWVSSLTDEAIRDGWSRLQPGERYDPLADAARCRSEADWLVGMNGTRAMTCRTREEGGDALWSVGRVQTPTLAMIVARDREIEAFEPETFFQVKAEVQAERGTWSAAWFRKELPAEKEKDDEAPKAERLPTREAAEQVAAAASGRDGVVASATRKTRRERPPLLFDLTSLQRRANQRYGMSAQHTLDVAQSLYEKHKLLTYPRTDARFLTSDQVGELPGVLEGVGALEVYRPTVAALLDAPLRITERLVDDSEVGDHHAIIPTGRRPDAGRLNADEKRIYDLVTRRLLAALSPDAVIDLAELIVHVPTDGALPDDVTSPLAFRAKGRVVREPGWQAVEPPKRRKQVELPVVDEGDAVTLGEAEISEGQTRPPRPHDDASILRAMETAGRALDDASLKRALRSAGLGTPATRASILQTLIDRDYVRRDKKALHATEKGMALIDAVPMEELKSAELTGRWEKRLSDMAEGGEAREAFMADVGTYLHRLVGAVREAAMPAAALVRTRPQEKALGSCPACGEPVRPRGPVFTCDTGRSCPFVVFSTMAKRKISARMVKQLLKEGKTDVVKGFKSRKGKDFEAGLTWNREKVAFWFPDRDDAPRRDGAPPPSEALPPPLPPGAPPPAPGDPCPVCGEGTVIRGRTKLGCSRWRQGCAFRADPT